MITEAQIKTIDYTGNTCQVEIPLFNSTNNIWPTILQAVFICPPGVYNGYKEGDLVWVAFERNRADLPVIIGKIYRGVAQENKAGGSTLIGSDLKATNSAEIPQSTKLSNAEAGYDTIKSLIDKIKELEARTAAKYQVYFDISYGSTTKTIFLNTIKKYDNNFGTTMFINNLRACGFKSYWNAVESKYVVDASLDVITTAGEIVKLTVWDRTYRYNDETHVYEYQEVPLTLCIVTGNSITTVSVSNFRCVSVDML